MRWLTVTLVLLFGLSGMGYAATSDLQSILQDNRKAVEKASRKTISVVLDALIASELDTVPAFLEAWQEKAVWQRKEDKQFYYVSGDPDAFDLIDITSGLVVASATKKDLKQLKPNSGVRGQIASALVAFQLLDPDITKRASSLDAIERRPEASNLAALRASIEGEPDPAMKARKLRMERLLTIRFDKDTDARVAAIRSFSGDLGLDVRATLNPILTTRVEVGADAPEGNLAGERLRGNGFSDDDAYAMLVEANLAAPIPSRAEIKAALVANIDEGAVAGTPVHQLNTEAARSEAYGALAEAGLAPPMVGADQRVAALNSYRFWELYQETAPEVTSAAKEVIDGISSRVAVAKTADLVLDGISLASIYFLAAIGLAITFGVMRVINMAHGEFIMMGAYTGYVIQQIVPNYTVSLVIAIPAAFAVTFAAGVLMERLVIRHLYHRPLETLLATFGISIALQQIAKNIFGTQARPLTSPAWLDGAWVMNDVVSISYIRIAIFVLALIFLGLLLFILNKTRLGLEVRAVTQNPRMASSMGINPDRINMLTFGLGSGIAGIAGVAIGLFAKVTSELGSDYIVQSFMTVVVGGVGNIWGTLAGATLIGFLQKSIEWFNPSNTLAAQTYMIVFIIIFIQFRPKGIFALKGRAAEV